MKSNRAGKLFKILFLNKFNRKIFNQMLDNAPKKRYEVISSLINDNGFNSFVEVGVWKGENLFEVADSCKCLGLIIGIDPYNENDYVKKTFFKEVTSAEPSQEVKDGVFNDVLMEASEDERIIIKRNKSVNAAKEIIDGSIDIVFIDGNHSYKSVKEDIKAWLPKVRAGGFLCGHNYELKYFSVIKAVNNVLGSDNIKLFPTCSIWCYKVTKRGG